MKKIGEDFQGWDANAMTLMEIIDDLGVTCTMDNGDEIIRGDKKHLLNVYPLVLEDDGMGYGIRPRYITSVSCDVYDDKELGEKVFNVFADSKDGDKKQLNMKDLTIEWLNNIKDISDKLREDTEIDRKLKETIKSKCTRCIEFLNKRMIYNVNGE